MRIAREILRNMQGPRWRVPAVASFSDDDLIAELERRGYIVSRPTPAARDGLSPYKTRREWQNTNSAGKNVEP